MSTGCCAHERLGSCCLQLGLDTRFPFQTANRTHIYASAVTVLYVFPSTVVVQCSKPCTRTARASSQVGQGSKRKIHRNDLYLSLPPSATRLSLLSR